MSVFVFVVKEAFDLPCLPQDYKDEIEISGLLKFFNKRLTEFFVFTTLSKCLATRSITTSFRIFSSKNERNFSAGSLFVIVRFYAEEYRD